MFEVHQESVQSGLYHGPRVVFVELGSGRHRWEDKVTRQAELDQLQAAEACGMKLREMVELRRRQGSFTGAGWGEQQGVLYVPLLARAEILKYK